ncbi:DUF4326 domain-containing protein [Catellatospora sp. NPDC049609]|uniref:DUF4326 domain-containing protein n=1 Tax=Catellatospora sp. NPDC049609 TaxID=3155505 RepID=UPI00342EBDC8
MGKRKHKPRRCGDCNHVLRDAKSRRLGYGPKCAARRWPNPTPNHISTSRPARAVPGQLDALALLAAPNGGGTPAGPGRVQRLRTRGSRLPDTAIYVGRPGPWGNPWTVRRDGAEWLVVHAWEPAIGGGFATPDAAVRAAIQLYRAHLDARPELVARIRTELAGRLLACWCAPGEPCHADVLLEIANPTATGGN